MSSVRRQFRLVIAGQKVDVETNALDTVKADRDGEGDLTKSMRVLHNACLRHRVDGTPVKFAEFLEQLDDVEDLTDQADEDEDADLDPTQATV